MNFIEFFIFFIPLKKIFKLSYTPNVLDLVFMFVEVVVLNLLPTDKHVLFVIIGQLLIPIYFVSTYIKLHKYDISMPILYSSVTIDIIILIQLGLTIVFNLLGVNINSIYTSIVANILSVILVYVIYNCTKILKVYELVTNASVYIRLIMVDVYIITVGIMINFKLDPNYTNTNFRLFTGIYITILLSSGGMIFYEHKAKIQNQIIESYSNSLPIYKSLLDEIRASQHEYDNRISTISSLLNSSADREEAIKLVNNYLNDYSNHSDIYPLVISNMPLLAASLYNQYAIAHSNGVAIEFSMPNQKLVCTLPEYQLTDFVCILVQNAVEASKPGDYVYVKITNEKDVLTVDVRNKVDKYYTNEQLYDLLYHECGKSNKKTEKNNGKHGYGLYYLRNKLKKLHCVLDAQCVHYNDENWLVIRMLI